MKILGSLIKFGFPIVKAEADRLAQSIIRQKTKRGYTQMFVIYENSFDIFCTPHP